MSNKMTTAKKIKLWGVIGAIVLIVVVILQNMEATPTRFLFVTVTMPRAVLLLITLAIGFVGGMVVANSIRKK